MSRRMDQAYVVVSLTHRGETRDLGVFNSWDGGAITSDDTKIRRGGTRVQRALGGPKTTENVTVERDYDLARDHPNMHWIAGAVGTGKGVMQWFPTDDSDQPYGPPLVYRGALIGATPPGFDMDSADPMTLSMEFSCDSPIG